MFITSPILVINDDDENSDKVIEGEDTIAADQVVFLVGKNIIINGQFTVLGEMIIL